MFQQARFAVRSPHLLPKVYTRVSRASISSVRGVKAFSGSRTLVLGSLCAVGAGTVWYTTETISNDSSPFAESSVGTKLLEASSISGLDIDGTLNSIIWGSNKSNTIAPHKQDANTVRLPTPVKWLENVALRDLALHESHAACVDARGDVYQWGDGFFDSGPSPPSNSPVITLRGKDIIQVQLTDSRVFALSKSGRVYILSSQASAQEPSNSSQASSSTSWWGGGWLSGQDGPADFAESTPNEALARGEKFISISAGRDHLLALTSSGRVFAHPVTKNANLHGQLGLRKFDIPDLSAPESSNNSRLTVELTPKAIADPYAQATPTRRSTSSLTYSVNLDNVDDKNIRFCDRLFEIPALRGVTVDQIAAGTRSSFVKTTTGRVLGWGANDYGQIGLGKDVTLATITKPTEVVLWRSVPQDTTSKCVNISTGGDLTLFTVERTDGSSMKTVDVLACGNGQWGGLGNALYRNAQSEPGRARNISGLLEYSEETQNLQPIMPHAISVSPTGHVLLTLDTQAHSGPGGGGRDLLAWGANYEYQLGNGKRTSLATPTTLLRPDGSRFMLTRTKAAVHDLSGKLWKRNVEVEQRPVAGFGNSVVYWRIC